MAINRYVRNPEDISDLGELEDVVRRIYEYNQKILKSKGEAGVLKLQNMQIGIIYIIDSEKNAQREINKEVIAGKTSEWGIKFFPRSYFEDLKKKLTQPTNSRY